MAFALRLATATQVVPIGPFVDSTDGNTEKTALTIANTDLKLLKGAATSEVSKNSGGATHIANGRYYATLDATDTNTLGGLRISCHMTGALYVWLDCVVYPAAVYDSLFAGSGAGLRAFIPAGSIDTDAIDANAIKADAVTEIQAGLMTSAGYTAPNNAGIASIVGKLPAGSIADEALVLAAIGTPLQAGSYTAPNNAGIASIVGKLPAGSIADEALVLAAIGTPLQAGSYTAPDNAGIASIVGKLPAGSIADEALVLAAIGTPLQAGSYTAPDNAGIASIVAKLPAGLMADEALLISAIATRLATSGYTAPDNAGIATIVAALPAGGFADETVILAAIGTPLQAGSYVAPHNANIDAILAALPGGGIADQTILLAAIATITSALPAGGIADAAVLASDVLDILGVLGTPTAMTMSDDLRDLRIQVLSRQAAFTGQVNITFPANLGLLSITPAGVVQANVRTVNSVVVNGAGTIQNPWGP